MSPCKKTKPRFTDERVRRFLTDCFFGNLDGMKEGLEEGLDPNLDRFGECPLQGALESQKFEAVKLLVDHGADVFRKGMLHRAASKGDPLFLTYMLQAGKKQNSSRVAEWVNELCGRDFDWRPERKRKDIQLTALEYVVITGDLASTNVLLEAGANPEPVNHRSNAKNQRSLVAQAVLNYRLGTAGALLMAGADPEPLKRLRGVDKDLLESYANKANAAPWRAYWAQKDLDKNLPQADAAEGARKRF